MGVTLILSVDDEGEPQKTGVRKGGGTRAEVAIRFVSYICRGTILSCEIGKFEIIVCLREGEGERGVLIKCYHV